LFVSNGQTQDVSEPSVTYADFQNDSQPANNENYSTMRTIENNPHAYSQIIPLYASLDAVPPSYGQYLTVAECWAVCWRS